MELVFEDVLRRLEKGESPSDIIASARPPEERELLKRCAAVRTVDRTLFERVLHPDAGSPAAPTFDALVAAPEIEPLPRRPHLFRLRGDAREAYWNAWWDDEPVPAETLPPALQGLVVRMVEYLGDAGDELELLAQTALIAPGEAADLLRRRYGEHDVQFDLAACRDLIDVLDDPLRSKLLHPDLKALRDDRAAYLRARSLWSTEYFNTATFVEPDGALNVYQQLLSDTGPRVLNLHAPGGRGKSIQLRWLIARKLVPECATPQGQPLGLGRIPCARIDFDLADPVNLTRYPWLALLELGAQLNQQLPGKPFNELLETHGWAVPLIRRDPSDPLRVQAASKRIRRENARATVLAPRQFTGAVRENLGTGPLVIVFDTLEEVHLRPQGDLHALLELLAALLRESPGVRLILAGRYDIPSILGASADVIGPMQDQEVGPLGSDDAHRYLVDLRRIDRPTVVRAIVEKADGDPFILSLLADIAQVRPALAPAEIRRYPADVIYLISRVVRRIQEPGVRWLLRYGVVPRTLSLTFVRDVMMRHVRAGLAGRRGLDEPSRDALPPELDGAGATFPTAAAGTRRRAPTADELWVQLRRYAGSTSWVFEDPSEPENLRFRADVRVAMRRVIRPRKVYGKLHADAADYFERLAEREPANWVRWRREALYHRFQLKGAAAYDHWRRALTEAGYSPSRREAIAAELLEPDYIDETGRPLPWDGTIPMVPPEAVIEAHLERAAALTELARLERAEPDAPVWSHAERSLSEAEHLQRRLGRSVIPPARLAYTRAGLALRDGRHEDAERELLEALAVAQDRLDVARLLTLLGDAQASRGDRAAATSYRRALDTARRLPRARGWLNVIRRRLVLAERQHDRLEEAAAESRKALKTSATGRDELLLIASEVALRSGRFGAAERSAETALAESGDWRAWTLRVDAAIALEDPLRAERLARDAAAAALAGAAGWGGSTSARTATADEMTALIAGELMAYRTAFSNLDKARSKWQTEGDLEAVMRCYVSSARLKLRGVSDLVAAQQHLDEAARLLQSRESDASVEQLMLRQELLAQRGRHDEAADLSRATLELLGSAEAPPRRLISAAAAGLAVCKPHERPQLLDHLIEQCGQVTPVSARILLLEPLKRAPVVSEPALTRRLERLRELLRLGSDPRLAPADRAVLGLILAEVDRVAGDAERAEHRLAVADRALRSTGTLFHVRTIALARHRLGRSAPPDEATAAAFLKRFARYPLLSGAFLVECAEARLTDDLQAAERLIDAAETRLDAAPEDQTIWHVRALEARAATRRQRGRPAGKLAAAAASLRLELGHPATPARTPPAHEDPLAALERSRVRVQLGVAPGGGLDVIATAPPDGEWRADVVGHPALMSQLTDGSPDLYAFGFVDWWIADWVAAGVELGRVLLPGDAMAALEGPGPATELRLELDQRRVNAVPWELARRPGGDLLARSPGVRGVSRASTGDAARRAEAHFLQLALNRLVRADLPVDRDAGPQTAAAVREYQRESGLPVDGAAGGPVFERIQRDLADALTPPPSVILVQPSAFRQTSGRRGVANFGVDLASVYRSVGFEVTRVENPDLDEIHAAVERAARGSAMPAVLHLCGGLRESSGGVSFTFLAGEWYSESLAGSSVAEDLSVTALDHILDAFPRESFRPLLILDVDRPRGITETTSHLLMRNAFAGDVFALGRCAALLAGGLVEGDQAGLVYSRLAQMLSRGASVAEACDGIRRMIPADASARFGPRRSPADLDRSVGPAATALFTHLPWLRPSLRW